jgi:hypothetical protein
VEFLVLAQVTRAVLLSKAFLSNSAAAACPGWIGTRGSPAEALGRRGRIRRLDLYEGGKFPVATCLVGSSCPRGRCPRPVLLARSPRRADEPATSGERRGLMTADILGP